MNDSNTITNIVKWFGANVLYNIKSSNAQYLKGLQAFKGRSLTPMILAYFCKSTPPAVPVICLESNDTVGVFSIVWLHNTNTVERTFLSNVDFITTV